MTRISAARIDLEGGRVDNSVLRNYAETLVGGSAGTNTTSSYNVNIANGNVFNLILNTNCTFTFSNSATSGKTTTFTLILKQDGTGGRTATWPASVVWPNGEVPILTITANRFDMLVFSTLNGGTTWLGALAGFNFS